MGFADVLDAETESLAAKIVDAIFKVHTTLGPGLLESVYIQCLCLELETRSLEVQRQTDVPIVYLHHTINPGLRLDILVEGKIIIEAKAVDAFHPIYYSQLKTYLKLSGKRLGILVNFNVPLIKDGIRRVIL